jgi:hypothetical protein
VLKMKSRSWSYVVQASVAFALAAALVLIGTTLAFAVVDEFGGAAFSTPYAPYTAGPVVDTRPYAPYTAGPVVREEFRPYAPYTAGPVVPEVGTVPDPYGHYPYR